MVQKKIYVVADFGLKVNTTQQIKKTLLILEEVRVSTILVNANLSVFLSVQHTLHTLYIYTLQVICVQYTLHIM